MISRAIGASNQTELEIEHSLLQSGDIFVICSDGLTVHLLDEEILECVGARGSQDACNLLIDRTLERGAVDNVTVVVVRYCRDESMLKSPVPGAASLRA